MLKIPRKDAVKMFVPVVGDGTEGNDYRADLPVVCVGGELHYVSALHGMFALGPGQLAELPGDVTGGRPAVKHVSVYLHPDVVDLVKAYLKKNHGTDTFAPSEHDRLWCRVMEDCDNGTCFRKDDVDAVLTAEMPDIATAKTARKADAKRVLQQAVYRGMRAVDAESLRVKHNIPKVTEIEANSGR